jgi:hypothetical protein
MGIFSPEFTLSNFSNLTSFPPAVAFLPCAAGSAGIVFSVVVSETLSIVLFLPRAVLTPSTAYRCGRLCQKLINRSPHHNPLKQVCSLIMGKGKNWTEDDSLKLIDAYKYVQEHKLGNTHPSKSSNVCQLRTQRELWTTKWRNNSLKAPRKKNGTCRQLLNDGIRC